MQTMSLSCKVSLKVINWITQLTKFKYIQIEWEKHLNQYKEWGRRIAINSINPKALKKEEEEKRN